MRIKLLSLKLLVVSIGIVFLLSSCATSNRIKYPMQRSNASNSPSKVWDAPNDSYKTEEQRVKGAFGQ